MGPGRGAGVCAVEISYKITDSVLVGSSSLASGAVTVV